MLMNVKAIFKQNSMTYHLAFKEDVRFANYSYVVKSF